MRSLVCWVPQVRGPHGQVFVRGVEVPFLGPGMARNPIDPVLVSQQKRTYQKGAQSYNARTATSSGPNETSVIPC